MLTERSIFPVDHPIHRCYRLMIFDLSIRGHHPSYIRHLIQSWYSRGRSGELLIVVSPQFLEEHVDVVTLADISKQNKVEFVAITTQEESALCSRKSASGRVFRVFQEWRLLRKYVQMLEATECLLPYFDTLQLPFALGCSLPCPFSGIYFRPTFHYPALGFCQPSYKDRLQHKREKSLVNRILGHSQLRTLFCLDPFAVESMQQDYSTTKVVHLPDPIERYEPLVTTVVQLKASLGIDLQRKVFLLFGSLTERKGIYQLLDAIALLSSKYCRQICLLLVGESNLKDNLEAHIQLLCAESPIQVIQHYEFVKDEVIPAYFQLADVVLAPYQQHVGMSGILLHAAAAGKPVLSSDYGLMGEVTRRYSLGITVNSSDPKAIAQGIIQCLLEPTENLGDRTKMQTFSEQNSAEKFASTVFQHLHGITANETVSSNSPYCSEVKRY